MTNNDARPAWAERPLEKNTAMTMDTPASTPYWPAPTIPPSGATGGWAHVDQQPLEQSAGLLRPSEGIEPPWTWCAGCQRVYLTGDARVVRFTPDALHPHPTTLKLCPYLDCGVSTARHGWRWATIRLEHPEYPTRPARDVLYVC